MRATALALLTGALAAQAQVDTGGWVPAWELTLRGDRNDVPAAGERTERGLARLRLRWSWEDGPWSAGLGLWGSLGSDGNHENRSYFDHQPSNGARVDTAWVQLGAAGEAGFLELRVGHQENPLLAQESLWDKDLRVTGASLRAAVRGEALQEFGIRATAGRVRTLLDGDVHLAAAQAVLRLDTGPLTWTAHAGRWALRWDASVLRERPLPGSTGGRQRLLQDAAGAGVVLHLPLPLEVKAIRHRDPDSGQDGAEFQAWIGARGRAWVPQAGYVWQRFDPRGTFAPVNGDDWWYVSNARGPRYELALPLPRRWLVVASYVRHLGYWPGAARWDRRLLQVIKRF